MWRKRTVSALFGLGLLAITAIGQPPAADKKPAEKVPEKKAADPVEALIEAALVHDPDVRMARAKVELAEAELAKARSLVTHKVISLKSTIEEQKRTVAANQTRVFEAERLLRNGSAPQSLLLDAREKLESAQAALALSETELKLITAGGPGSRVLQAPQDDVHRLAKASWQGCAVCHQVGPTPHSGLDVPRRPADQAPALSPPTVWTEELLLYAAMMNQRYSPPAGPVSDRIRVALDKKVRLGPKGEAVPFDKALEVFKTEAGLDIPVRPMPRPMPVIESQGETLPIGAWFQLYQDTGRKGEPLVFYVREYGLLVANRQTAPPDAQTITQLWKQPLPGTNSPAPNIAPAPGRRDTYDRTTLPNPLKLKVGDMVMVVEPVNPSAVDNVKVYSDSPGVTVDGQDKTGDKQTITIRATKSGKAKVTWTITTSDGKVLKQESLVVEVE
jgi:hypothetical protein